MVRLEQEADCRSPKAVTKSTIQVISHPRDDFKGGWYLGISGLRLAIRIILSRVVVPLSWMVSGVMGCAL